MRKLIFVLGMLLNAGAYAAFPAVASTTPSTNDDTTSHVISYPATVPAGALVVVHFNCTNTGCNPTTPSGFTAIKASTNYTSGDFCGDASIFAKKAAGTEGGTTFTITSAQAGADTSATLLQVITGWGGDATITNDIVCSTTFATTTGTVNPDPASVTATWGSADNLFIATAFTCDDDSVASVAPTNYSGLQTVQAGGGVNDGPAQHLATRQLASDADDPGTFTISINDVSYAGTCVVEPGSSGSSGLLLRRRRN